LEALILRPGSSPLTNNIEDYPEGIIIPIDKPYRWTSADVIRKIKFAAIRHFGKKNLKVGHAGTLDPLATGILLVCIGKATKLAEELQKHDKEYIAGITFGATTPSYDLEKEIDRFFPHDHITATAVEHVLPSFIGEQDQVAPLFSAKSVDGVRAYELARKLHRHPLAGGGMSSPSITGCPTGTVASDDPRPSVDGHPLAGGGMTSPSITGCPTGTVASDDPRPSIDGHPLAGGGMSSPATVPVGSITDEAAKELLRVSRINIMELELLKFRKGQPEVIGADEVSPAEVVPEQALSKASARINVTDNSALGLPRAEIRINCSKGTYIRAFARDLGEALGSGAHLDALQRSRSGIFRIENALSVEEAMSLIGNPSERSH